jgi:hypothetical protein
VSHNVCTKGGYGGEFEGQLEHFLNQLEGDILSVVPYVTPTFQGMGATAKVSFLLVVEKVG